MKLVVDGRLLVVLALVALAAGCAPPIVPGPIGTPSPGGSATPAPSASPPDTLVCTDRFARFDTDGDGRWQPIETARWLYTYPLVPTYGPCERQPAVTPSPDRVVTQVDGTGSATAGGATVEPACPLPPDPDTVAARLDRNGDGSLSVGEACVFISEQVACEARFQSADQNGDGRLGLDEYTAARRGLPENPLSQANPAPPEVAFRALDGNNDGSLSEAELCGLQRISFARPSGDNLSGLWAFGSTDEPVEGPLFGVCPPGSSLRLTQDGENVTGQEMVCAGPCFVPTALTGTYLTGALTLTGTVPAPAEDAGRRLTYALRFDTKTGHLVGTRDGKPYWAAPFLQVKSDQAPCPL